MTSSNNGVKLRTPKGVSQVTIDHFATTPSARATMDDPNFHLVSMSRTVTHSGRGHTLMAKTWNTDGTIKELMSLYRPSAYSKVAFPQPEGEGAEVRRFYTFGSDMNAHPDLLHGGVVASILDSSMGGVIGLTFSENREAPRFTVQLNVTYKKPVRTPATVMVRGWITDVKEGGRKVWAHGVIEGEGGIIHATAEGMWLQGKSKL